MGNFVRKRDGRIEPFRDEKLIGALKRALGSSVDANSEGLFRELARSISYFLFRSETRPHSRHSRAVSSFEISQATLRALNETGHGRIAKLWKEHQEWRDKHRQKVVLPSGGVSIYDESGENPWSKAKIVEALIRETKLDPDLSADIARCVEERLFATNLQRVSANLLREMIDAELRSRGFSARIQKREHFGLSRHELRQFIDQGHGQDPLGLRQKIADATLRRFHMEHGLEGREVLALQHGALALTGLSQPFRFQGLTVDSSVCEDFTDAGDIQSWLNYLSRVRHWSKPCHGAVTVDISNTDLAALKDTEQAIVCRLFKDFGAERAVNIRISGALPEVDSAAGKALLGCPLCVDLRAEKLQSSQASQFVSRFAGLLTASESRELSLTVSLGDDGDCGDGAFLRSPSIALGDTAAINLVRCALLAGRGERKRFSQTLDLALDFALRALASRHELFEGAVLSPNMPLWGPEERRHGQAIPRFIQGPNMAYGLVPVGLPGALGYLTGTALGDNARVEKLGEEIYRELRESFRKKAKQMPFKVTLMDPQEPVFKDIAADFASADLLGFEDAEDLRAIPQAYVAGVPGLEFSLKRKLSRALGVATVLTLPLLKSVTLKELERRIAALRGV